MNLIFYHKDMDGECGAAIAYREIKRYNEGVTLYPIDYGDEIPIFSDNFKKVYIIDFSFEPKYMKQLENQYGRENIIWIDHHISAINKLSDYYDLSGIRSVDYSGSMLTWKYFNNEKPVPIAVVLVNDYDLYKLQYGSNTKGFKEWYNYNNTEPETIMWDRLLTMDFEEIMKVCDEGFIYHTIKRKTLINDIHKNGYIDELDGIKCFKINMTDNTSDASDYVLNNLGHELFWSYSDTKINNDVKTIHQLRSNTINVNEIAEKFGGGGHKRAAGFLTDKKEKGDDC